jgi:hypothetical protein
VQHVFLFVLGFSAGRLLMRNWVCFAIFRIGSQMASFRKSLAANATLHWPGYATAAPKWRQLIDYEVVN